MRRSLAAFFALTLAASLAPVAASAHAPNHPHKCWDSPRHLHWHWC